MNIHSDHLANVSHKLPRKPYTPAPGYRDLLMIESNPITTKYAKMIRLEANTEDYAVCPQHRDTCSMTYMRLIDWDAIFHYIKSASISKRIRTVKYIHDKVPTRRQLHRMDNLGPFFCGSLETSHLIIRCPLCRPILDSAIRDLQVLLDKIKTTTAVREPIMHMATKGYEEEFQPKRKYQAQILIEYNHQRRIGIWHISRGLLAQKIGEYQEDAY